MYKKKAEAIYNTTTIKKTINIYQSTQQRILRPSNKENISTYNDYSMDSYPDRCPFDSPTSLDLNFDTSEIFSNMRKTNTENILQNTYDKSYSSNSNLNVPVPQMVLKPLNKQLTDNFASEIFDNLTFTPLKSLNTKNEKLDKGPKIILSMNSESDFDDSLDMKKKNKENETSSIVITSSQPPNKWLTVNHQQQTQLENICMETPTIQNKIPNTSSPKELNNPNFSINTEFSRISDLSFLPQRFSTERKVLPKSSNETHEILLDPNANLNSDTYTKESPNTPLDFQYNQMYGDTKPPNFFMKDQTKICRQALFKENQRNLLNPCDVNVWQNNLRADIRSPPRSISPPLQSIPEESTQFSDTRLFNKTDKRMSTFTINRTFDKIDRSGLSTSSRQSWSKKAVRCEPELWKVPVPLPRKSLKPKPNVNSKDSLSGRLSTTFEKSMNQNITVNQLGNVYSQSTTVDPFLSATYFYDEEAVHKFETEFKRWLNCILTPPADLDTNIEHKIDVGKAWIENRNKEVPTAPTKEQVCIVYHNNHRLESLRRLAKTLLMSSEITQVIQKLNAQIEKKLIAIRTDRNLHLDVGLQKIIMELLLSYNPLWLRIGLEAIYGLVLPLKSNNDIEGLTTFIIHRMFKNPHLKNKHSKSNAPNMLLPAYMDAIKKFTLKKFFMLVFFLDQAKQKKLIPHDPCLFCRNAICKESREIIIRFTRELIAGIGDITKHLRPLGYVVSHKQSYLDEYKYGVHNIAIDIRDGVRLTKVMEIILMKNGLLNQLRTPAISRLQKIHNVQVAFNALKEANFVIEGDISAQDIADGHREKTLSLLWQLIHVFRAPLFEKAANVIQTWWRKKYEIIMEKKREEEKIRQVQNNAANTIQSWWRRTQYNRLVEWQMQQITTATILLQKYWRTWLCKKRFRKMKTSVRTIEEWYMSVKMIKEAKATLDKLKQEREEQRRKSAIVIQSYVRCWLCAKQYKAEVRKIVLVQSIARSFIARRNYMKLRKYVEYVQQKYKGKLLMRKEMQTLAQMRHNAVVLQSYWRMNKQRKTFLKLKKSVKIFEERFIALRRMRSEQTKFKELKRIVIFTQALYRGKQCRVDYLRKRHLIVTLQKKIRVYLLMKKEKARYIQIKKAAGVLQCHVRSFLAMKKARHLYITQRKSTILIQQWFRSVLLGKIQRNSYVELREAAIVFQSRYRSLLAMRQQRSTYLKLKLAAILIQRQYRAQILMKHFRQTYNRLRASAIIIQRKFRAQMNMRHDRSMYLKLKKSCVLIQNTFKAYRIGKKQREHFLKVKDASIKIQKWFRSWKQVKQIQRYYIQTKQACVTIQRNYRAYKVGKQQRQEYRRITTATVCIQNYYRSYIEMKIIRERYIQLKTATVTIQRYYKAYLTTKKQRNEYLKIKHATNYIQKFYRCYRESKIIRHEYFVLRNTIVYVQRRYRSIRAMRTEREKYFKIKQSTVTLQQRFRAMLEMKSQRQTYQKLRTAAIVIQRRYRANCLMKNERVTYVTTLKAIITIQRFYRAFKAGRNQREQYLKLKKCANILQYKFRALVAMKKDRSLYLKTRSAAIIIQRKWRAHTLMLQESRKFQTILHSSITIQRVFRAYIIGKRQRTEYIDKKRAVIFIQKWFRSLKETRRIHEEYLQLRNAVILIQHRFRFKIVRREIRRENAAIKIQTWYHSIQSRNKCRNEFLMLKKNAITLQSTFRMYLLRKRYIRMKNSAVCIQKFYRYYRLCVTERRNYVVLKTSVIKLQSYVRSFIERKRFLRIRSAVVTIQAAYRLKKQKETTKKLRQAAAVCIQKYFRRHYIQKWYQNYRKRIMFIQLMWRGQLVTRLIRCEYLQKRRIIIKLQSAIRGYLVRKQVECKKADIQKIKEENRRQWAASKIQVRIYLNFLNCCVP